MATKVLGLMLSRFVLVVGIVLSGTAVLYAQAGLGEAARVAEAVASASADDPLLTVIKVMAYVVLAALALSAYLIRIIVKQTESTTNMASKPCVLAHANPTLFAKLLEQSK